MRPLRETLEQPVARGAVAFGLVLLLGAVFNANGAFFSWGTHASLLREISVLGILASGLTLVIVAGGIDLSVGSVLALAAVTFSKLAMHAGLGEGLSLVLVLLLGAGLGALSGTLVARFRLPAFVITLAAMVFARGLAKLVADGKKVTTYVELAGGASRVAPTPKLFAFLDSKVLGERVAAVTLVFAAVLVVTHLVLTRLELGRYLRAVGGNAEAARLSGVPVVRVTILAYALSGLFAAIAGVCQASQETFGDPETGTGYELDAIAMVVLGGTSLAGGRGGAPLTLLGALTLGYLQKILSLNALRPETRLMSTGVILAIAALVQRSRTRR